LLCYAFPKTLYPGGIRTRVFYSWGGWDVHRAAPTGHEESFYNIDFSAQSPRKIPKLIFDIQTFVKKSESVQMSEWWIKFF
jgi:hypothetical protein